MEKEQPTQLRPLEILHLPLPLMPLQKPLHILHHILHPEPRKDLQVLHRLAQDLALGPRGPAILLLRADLEDLVEEEARFGEGERGDVVEFAELEVRGGFLVARGEFAGAGVGDGSGAFGEGGS